MHSMTYGKWDWINTCPTIAALGFLVGAISLLL